jgi:phage regulator Rha-like protein
METPIETTMVQGCAATEPTMSSREIAELTGKRHDNVLADCDKLNENYKEMTLPEISVGVYTHSNTGNQKHRELLLTKMQTFDLLTGYSAPLRIKVNRRWEELEKKEIQAPTAISADQIIAIGQRMKELEIKIELDRPKVQFADEVQEVDDGISIEEYAK